MSKEKIVTISTKNTDLVVVTDEMLEAGYDELLDQENEMDKKLFVQAIYLAMEYQRRAQSDQPLRFHQHISQI